MKLATLEEKLEGLAALKELEAEGKNVAVAVELLEEAISDDLKVIRQQEQKVR